LSQLTPKKKRHLRSVGQKLPVTCIVGKAGVTDAVAQSVSAQLATRELVKIRIPAGTGDARTGIARKLASATDSTCVAVLGRTAMLYRGAAKKPEDAV